MKKACRPAAPDPLRTLSSVYLVCMMTVFLFATGTQGYLAISEAKFSLFWKLTGGYAALCALCWIELLIVGAARIQRPHLTGTERCLAVYLAVTVLSWACSPYRQAAWIGGRYEGLASIFLCAAAFFLVSRHAVLQMWMVHVFGGAMMAFDLLCTLQLLGRNPLNLYPAGQTYYDAGTAYAGAYLGTTGNVDLTAGFLCLAVPLLAGAVWAGRGRGRIWLLIPALWSITLLLWLHVAAGFAGIVAVLLLCTPLFASDRRRRQLLALSLLALFGGLGLVFILGQGLGGTLGELSSLLHGQISPQFGSGRFMIWAAVWKAFLHRPLLGGGPDTLGYWITESFQRYDASLGITLSASINSAHNQYLGILANQGVFALVAYCGALSCSCRNWIRGFRDQPVAAMCGCAALCYCAQAFFAISSCGTTIFFWLCWALLESALRQR